MRAVRGANPSNSSAARRHAAASAPLRASPGSGWRPLPARAAPGQQQAQQQALPQREGGRPASGGGDGSNPQRPAPTGLRVRVQHESWLRASRETVWCLLQEVTPPQQWRQLAVVLATLESIYGVEYQGLAVQLLTAYQQANRAAAGGSTQGGGGGSGAVASSSSSSSSSAGASPEAAAATSSNGSSSLLSVDESEGRRPAQLGNGSNIRAAGGSAAPHPSAAPLPPVPAVLATDGSSDGLGGSAAEQRGGNRGAADADADADAEVAETEAVAAAADAAFVQLLLLLAGRAGFLPMSERDVRLSSSLNSDWLWEIFIKVNTERLDRGLVASHVGGGGGGQQQQLPDELQSMLVLRRGYSSERQRGRLLLAKLDYLQVLLVSWALGGLGSLGRQAASGLRRALQAALGRTRSEPSGAGGRGPRAAVPGGRQARRRQRSSGGGASGGNSKQPARRRGPPTDGFGRPYPEQPEEQAASGSSSSSSSRSSRSSDEARVGVSSSSSGGGDGAAGGDPARQPLAAHLASRGKEAAGRAARVLSEWGLIPRLHVMSLGEFERAFPLSEPARLASPLFIEKASLPDLLDPVVAQRLPWLRRGGGGGGEAAHGVAGEERPGGGAEAAGEKGGAGADGGLLAALLEPVEVVEPTFRQLLVVYRKKPRPDRWRRLREQLGLAPPAAAGQQAARPPIQLQVYRDIPLPSWLVVFPDRLLQFRPLDLIRLDLFGLAGAVAALANAKYSSLLLELLSLVSLSVWGTRVVLAYVRMGDRYNSLLAQLLAARTVASGEGGIEYLATAAGLQQFKQAALAFVALSASPQPLSEEALAASAERLLRRLGLQVAFDAGAALRELARFGLLLQRRSGLEQQEQAPAPAADAGSAPSERRAEEALPQAPRHEVGGGGGGGGAPPAPPAVYSVVDAKAAQKLLEGYWSRVLQQRVASILRQHL